MRHLMRYSCLLVLLLLLVAIPSASQTDLEKSLKQYNGATVQGYIQPLADLFGANMQAGLVRSAAIPKSGFHLSFRLIGMGSLLKDEQKQYNAPTPAGWTPATFSTATVFGGIGTTIKHPTITTLEFKGSDGVFSTTIFPMAVPELSVGSIYGTQFSGRFVPIPKLNGDKFPSGTLWGVGLRHSISQYIEKAPLDMAVGGFFNSFTLGDIVDFKAYSVSAQASKQISVLILYGGFSYENSRMKLTYQTTDPSVPPAVEITLDGANNFRFTLGAGLSFGLFGIYADASFGPVTNFSIGIGLGG